MKQPHEWRDLQAWKDTTGLHFSTTSNEAAKLYDAVLTQWMGFYDDSQLGGISGTLNRLHAADPNFILGRTLRPAITLLGVGASVHTDSELSKEIEWLKSQKTQAKYLTVRERAHVEVLLLWANGEIKAATDAYEDILVQHPTDVHALKIVYSLYFTHRTRDGGSELRDTVARVLPFWESRSSPLPLKNYLHGMLALGLEGLNLFAIAEAEAKKGLELNPADVFASHALAHVYDEDSRPDEGVRFLSGTVADWETCNHLAGHNFWHLALFHLERGELDAAMDIFDRQLRPRAQADGRSVLEIADACSLLWRVELAKEVDTLEIKENDHDHADLPESWAELFEICQPHLGDQILGFNDAHYMMAALRGGSVEEATKLLNSATGRKQPPLPMYANTLHVTEPLLRGLIAFSKERYPEVVQHLYPIRNSFPMLGGSRVQRDVFQQTLLYAAIKAESERECDPAHAEMKFSPSPNSLALRLLSERKYFRTESPLTDRYANLLAKFKNA